MRIVLAAGRHAEDGPDPPQTHRVVVIDVFIAVMSTGMLLVLSLIGFQVLAGRARHDGPSGIIYLRRHNSLMTKVPPEMSHKPGQSGRSAVTPAGKPTRCLSCQ